MLPAARCPLPSAHCPRPAAVCLLAAALWLLTAANASADAPSISYIFPAGGQRGTSVAFHVGGHYLHEVCPFEMTGPGVEATPQLYRAPRTVWFEGPRIPMPASQAGEDYPKDQAGAVTIAADAPLGFRRFRVWTSQGAVPTMKFVVGDLPEIVEEEIDGRAIPAPINLPVTVNGRIFPREDVDIWTFDAIAGRSYTCEVMAARLGSALDSRLEVRGPDGGLIAENVDGIGADSFLQFTAPTDGVYSIKIHDINFGGLQNYVYRLTVNDGPHINHVYPLGGRRGSATTFHFDGVNLPQPHAALTLPKTDAERFDHAFAFESRKTNSISLELSDLPEVLEEEAAAKKSSARELPAVFNGRILTDGEVDRWTISAQQGIEYLFDLRAARLGSRLDSVLTVEDANGKVLAENDNLSGEQTDSQFKFTFPADGVYTVTVRERTPRRSGLGFAYRLYATPAPQVPADFRLKLTADMLTLNRGAEVSFAIDAERLGGCDGPIELSFDGLPAGVTVSETTIPANKTKAQVKFKADDTAKIQAVRLGVTGKCLDGEREIVRAATTAEEPVLDHLLLAVAMPTPFKVIGAFETNYVPRGATYFRHYTIDRGGFEGPLTISLADRQVRHLQGISAPSLTVPPGQSEFDFKIKLPPWMQPARTSRTVVMAVGEITDADGTKHKVSYSSPTADDQIIMMVTTGELTIDVTPKSILAVPGKSVTVTIHVGRGKSVPGPVKLELAVPEHMRGVTAQPVVAAADTSEVAMTVTFSENEMGPFNMPLLIRGTTHQDGQPYTAEAKIEALLDP